jgi:hypothetical protein
MLAIGIITRLVKLLLGTAGRPDDAAHEPSLVKVNVDLPNHWATGGESMWARPLGDDLYELQNVPFYAYGLNYLDIVYAVAASPDLKPEIQSVRRPSGHRTLHVMVGECVPEDQQAPLLQRLKPLVWCPK